MSYLIRLIVIAFVACMHNHNAISPRQRNGKQHYRKPSAIHLYAVNQATIDLEQPEELQDHVSENNVAVVGSNCSYAAIPATEQHQSQTNSAAPMESTLQEAKESKCLHYQPLSSEESPKPTEVTAEYEYAAVDKQSKKNAETAAEANPEESSEETVELDHVRLPPTKQISANGETHIYHNIYVCNVI